MLFNIVCIYIYIYISAKAPPIAWHFMLPLQGFDLHGPIVGFNKNHDCSIAKKNLPAKSDG